MSRSAAFSNALSKVSSDKVRERAEGMEQLRTIFQSQTSVENLSSVTDGVGWLQTFQTLFGVVKMERDQCLKRGKSTSSSSASSAAETRLSKAMSLVRWLIERSLTHLNKKVINALFNHLTQIIISPDGRLVRNSMDYIKALKIVVSFAPHLEHLDSASWQHLMSICWDAALGEHLQHNKADWDEDDLDDDVSKESRELEEEEEEEDDSDDNRDVDMTSVNGTARKRKLPSTASSLTSRHGSRQPITPKVLPLSTEITELLSIVPILLAVPNAPILPPPQLPESDYLSDKALPRVAIRILHRVLRFLEERPAETAAHRPVLMTLNMVLGELELNAVQEMIDKAPKILSLLVPLWNTKLKDQLVISLRIILPFLSSTRFEYDKVPEEKRISREVFNDLMQLRDSVSRTTPGRKTMVLDMTYLALRYNTGHEESTKAKLALPLQTPLMSATSDFTDAMVETWATLELMADNLNMLHQHHESTSLRSTATSTGSNKRQRIEEPVADMLSAIALARQVESRLFSLQTMYFFITRHWEGLHVRLQGSITNTLHHLVVDPNPEVQQWADINLAAICLAVKSEHSGTQEDSTDTLAPAQQQPQGQDQWLEIWQLALRKMTVVAGTSSRSAALLLQVIMRNQIVDPVLLITSIEKFMEGVSDQGPIAPYESVCDFMMDCLDIVEQDARLYRLGFSTKVTEWFRTAWMGQEKVGLDAVGRNTLDISSAFNMISRLSGLSTSYQISLNHRPLTSSSIAIRMQKEKHTIDIRNFVLHTTFPPRTFVRRSRRAMPWNSASEVKPRIYSTVQVRALSRLFTLKLQQIDLADGDATNVAKLRGKLDACMLIMLAESSFIDSDPEHPQINFEATCQLLEKILQITLQTNWTLLERATLFIAIDVLFPDTAENDSRQEAASPLLCRPGPASGILSVASIPEEEVSTRSGQVTAIPSLYRQLWRKPKLCDMFRSRSGDFYRLLRGEDLYGSMPVTGYDTNHIDDDFDTIRVDDESMQNGTAQTDDRIAEVIIEGSIRCCLLPKYCLNDMPTPVKDRTILNILIDAEPALFLRLCNPIFSAIRNGFLDFNDDAAGTIYETLQDYLSSYTYSLSSVMRQIAATLIDTILSRLPPITGDSFCNPSGEAAAGLLDWLGANLRKGKLLFWEERLVVIRLYARLIELDPRNIFWSRRETNSPRNDIADPVTLLCRSLEDSDARLRFRLTAIVSRLFQILPGRNFAALYRDCLSNLHTRGFQVEYILSNLVFYLNITCVSAAGRFNALFHIYDTAYERTFTRAHAHAGLQAVISTLQLANISELYLQYATRITQLQFNEEQAPEKLPMQLYGFQSRKQWATAVLSSVGPVALMMNKTWVWERLCGLAGLSKDDGLQRIFSATFGYRLALDIDALLLAQQSSMVSADIAETARKYEKEVASLGDMADIHSHPIDTVSSVIVMPGHEDTTNDLLSILQSQEDGTARYNAFVSLYCRKESPQLELDEVLAPVIHARASVRVMQWIERSNRTTSLEMMLYNVSMQIVGKLDANILVNERMRLMRNLAFFMAYHYRSFIESPVLGFVVLRTATALTQQRDLAIIAFNMISWILPQIEYMKGSESDLVPLLAKLSSVAWIYFTEPRTEGDEQFHQAAVQFLGTLESFLRCLLSTSRCPSTLRSSAFVELLPIWPRELPNESNAMLRSMSRAKLLEIVQRPTIHAQVFALVNQLAVKSSESQEHEMELFSSNVFWQLKDAISEGDIPHSKETSAFLELCYANGGRIRMIDPDTATALRSKFSATLIRSSKARPDAIQTTRDILFAIVDRLSHSHLGTLYRAYQTLCVVASKILREIQPFVKIPSRLQAETALLDTRSPDLRVDHIEFMDFVGIVSASEAWLMRPMHTDRWVREFASVACLESANSGGLLVEAALLLQHDLQLSRQLLPHLLHLLLQKEESVPAPTTRPAIRDALSGYFKRILESTKLPIATKKVVIDILLYLRQQNRPTSLSHLDNDYWVDLNFALVARVALDCKMYATALLYWELHSDSTSEGKENAFQEDDFTLLYEIYNNIDEPDGFYGIPLEKDVKNSLLQRFQHESNWALAFKYYGADLEANGSSAGQLPQLARSLQAFGMDKLALMLFRSGKSSSFNQSQLRLPYDIAWRTQSWDLPATMFVPESSDRSIYAALRAIHRSRDVEETRRVVGNIEREEVISIQTFSLEDVHGLRKKMKELLSLREISRWCNVYLPMVNSEASSVDRYQSFLEVPAHIEPEMTEQIMSVRLSLIRSARQQDEWQLGDMVASRGRFLLQLERGCLQQLGLLARERKDLNGAIKILAEQQSLTAIDAADHVTEFAEVLWLQGDHGLAIDQLKNTLGVSGAAVKSSAEKGKSSLNPVVHSKILSRVGQWMAEAKQAHPEVIYKEYFVRSYEIIHGDGASPLPEEKALIYSRFACFTDQEYERILHLSELEQRHLVQQHWAFETKQSDVLAQNSRKGSTGLSARPKTQQGNSGLLGEHTIYKDFDAIKRQYLEFAIVMYARSMTYSEKYNDSVHRLCALWLANSADNQTNNGIKAWMLNVPTHKFAFLASQLTARLDAENDKSVFQEVLTFLLTKLCEQHPFHIMYQVITLARAVQSHTKTINSSRNGKPRGVNGRELAAFNLLTRIRSIPKRTAQISDMECFANASVSWCDYKQERGKVKEYQVPANAPLAGLKDLCIPVPTQHIPFDLTFSYARSYDKGPAFIQSYERTFTLAGGLHMPKIMVCIGHDGRRYRQLFKNDDDLRQDSVMEQVFSLVNTLLLRDEATAKRELRFKTYTVLPLANSTGIIEFVPDSIGIGDWLGDAHKRYRPSDISPTEFRNDMRAIQQNRENPNPELIKRFVNNRAFFKPVMRHFFTDMRNDPIGWYSMRLTYARSVAVGSIVGHLVGLGDRHCSNIMINTKTGEILHIDLGIAFDQGEDLGIPERVPFRLTADIIDGLGSFGLEGVYKRCCEQTLRLLREKADLILAVLEVFKHDPLQKWKADFDKVHKMQGGAAAKAHKNKMEAHASELATLALDRVRTKLLNTTSVEYTVNELIRIATDPANLATIFHGWQPWL